MSITLQATCSSGTLIPDRKLSSDLEGKTLQIIILEPEDRPDIDEASVALDKVEEFLEGVQQYSFKIPTDYTFNRDKLYNR